MKDDRTYLDYVEDIREAIVKVSEFIAGMTRADFMTDDKTAFAVIRAFEMIGEASKLVPGSVRSEYPDIPWQEMAQMRDKLIHHYFGVDRDVVWKTATEQLPDLLPVVDRALRRMREAH